MLWAVSTSAEAPMFVWALPPNVGGTAQRHVQVHRHTTSSALIMASATLLWCAIISSLRDSWIHGLKLRVTIAASR